jgi:hypothetical protein
LQDLFVRWSDGVVGFGKLPTHYSLGIDHIRRWMRPAFAVRVEKPIAVDHFVIGILKQGKAWAAIVCRLKFLTELFRFFMAVDAYCENLRFRTILFVEQALQLAELRDAIGSPMAAIKNQYDILFTAVIGKADVLAFGIL